MSFIEVHDELIIRFKTTGEELHIGAEDFEWERGDVEPRPMGVEITYFSEIEFVSPSGEAGAVTCELYEYPKGTYNHHDLYVSDNLEIGQDVSFVIYESDEALDHTEETIRLYRDDLRELAK